MNMDLIRRILPSAWPVALNELMWSWGITTYNIIYARISTESIAAVNIAAAIDQIAFVLFSGIAHGTSVLVGNWIGAGDHDEAFRYAGRSMILSFLLAIGMGALILLFSPVILSWYKVSPDVLENAKKILVVIAAFMWLRAMNIVLILGVFRSGGDTRFGLFLDGIIIWILGVPLAYMAAFLFHLPVHLVYLFVMSEEITKFILGIRRYLTKRWIHNLVKPGEVIPVIE
jgi:Na+-driven multidrug efflux pump